MCTEQLMLHTRTEREIWEYLGSMKFIVGTFAKHLGKEMRTRWTLFNFANIPSKQLVSRYLPNNICHFGSPTFLWRGTQLKLLFQAFLTAISMAYIFTAQKIHWECHFVPHLFWRDGIFLWNYFPRSFTVGAFTARSLTASTVSHDENADRWWPI